jgi:guanylate kinase
VNVAAGRRRAKRRGNIIVLSAPSGTGKTTLVRRLMEAVPDLAFSVSCTTRAPRAGEKNGRDYYFVSRKQFQRMVRRGEFAEWANVFGEFYGTTRKQLREAQSAGRDILLDIDVQGRRQLKRRLPEAVSIFVLPPSFRELSLRLRRRSGDSHEAIARRLRDSGREISSWKEYDYLIVNDRVSRAVEGLAAIVKAARLSRESQRQRVVKICKTFGG